MSERRKEKLTEIYKRAANSFIQDSVKFENTIVSVTNVELSDKLNHLKIFFSVFPDDKEAAVIKALKGLKGGLRGALAEEVRTKFVPEIDYVLDESDKKWLKIDELLKKDENSS